MKSKNTLCVPDDFYEALGIILPFSKVGMSEEYVNLKTITDFTG